MPDQDAVVAITADTGGMQDELNAIWNKLYPAFRPWPLPRNNVAQEKLKQAEANLEAHPRKSAGG